MRTYVCASCGYRKNESGMLNNLLEFPVYPTYDASIMMPFVAMQHMYEDDNTCPGCGKSTQWICCEV